MSLSRLTWAVALLVALVVITGCGGDDDDGGSDAAGGGGTEAVDERVDAGAFADAFRKSTGAKLTPTKSSTWVLLDPPSDSDTYGEYGTFSIYVLTSVDQGLDILTDDDKRKPIEADADGIYWKPNESGSWTATKVFAGNVVLVWQAGDEKRTDDRWDRLSAAIEKSAGAAGS